MPKRKNEAAGEATTAPVVTEIAPAQQPVTTITAPAPLVKATVPDPEEEELTPRDGTLVSLIKKLARSVETLSKEIDRTKLAYANTQQEIRNFKIDAVLFFKKDIQAMIKDEAQKAFLMGKLNPKSSPDEINSALEELPEQDFFAKVPRDLLVTALEILGNKFRFECVSCTDRPAFEFTIIVPPEYSPLPRGQQDRRTKVIDNSLGANGVREYCEKVKANVVKTLGKQITI